MGNNCCLFIEPYITRDYSLWERVKYVVVYEVTARLETLRI